MSSKLLLAAFLITIVSSSCQKEISWNDDVKFCGVSSITIRNGSGVITEKYEYQYDTVSRRPNMFRHKNLVSGAITTIFPVYSKDTIYLGSENFIIVDASNRIKTLTQKDLITGNTLTYYYTYNSLGYVDQRLVDNGIDDASRTYFSYDNGSLSGYKQDYQGYPQALSAVVSYQQSTRLSGYYEYSLVELFPELLLYLPGVQLGKSSGYAIKQVEKTLNTNNLPSVSVTDTYSNYSVNSEGWLSAFQTDIMLSGTPKTTSKYEINYQCF
jgi:hypothetical protein